MSPPRERFIATKTVISEQGMMSAAEVRALQTTSSELIPDPKSPSQQEIASSHCVLAGAHTLRAAQRAEPLEDKELPCYRVRLFALFSGGASSVLSLHTPV